MPKQHTATYCSKKQDKQSGLFRTQKKKQETRSTEASTGYNSIMHEVKQSMDCVSHNTSNIVLQEKQLVWTLNKTFFCFGH